LKELEGQLKTTNEKISNQDKTKKDLEKEITEL